MSRNQATPASNSLLYVSPQLARRAVVHYSVSLIVLSSAAIKRQFSTTLNSRNCEREQFRGFFLRGCTNAGKPHAVYTSHFPTVRKHARVFGYHKRKRRKGK